MLIPNLRGLLGRQRGCRRWVAGQFLVTEFLGPLFELVLVGLLSHLVKEDRNEGKVKILRLPNGISDLIPHTRRGGPPVRLRSETSSLARLREKARRT